MIRERISGTLQSVAHLQKQKQSALKKCTNMCVRSAMSGCIYLDYHKVYLWNWTVHKSVLTECKFVCVCTKVQHLSANSAAECIKRVHVCAYKSAILEHKQCHWTVDTSASRECMCVHCATAASLLLCPRSGARPRCLSLCLITITIVIFIIIIINKS